MGSFHGIDVLVGNHHAALRIFSTSRVPFAPSGLPSFLNRTEHLNENRLCNQHFSEPFDQGV